MRSMAPVGRHRRRGRDGSVAEQERPRRKAPPPPAPSTGHPLPPRRRGHRPLPPPLTHAPLATPCQRICPRDGRPRSVPRGGPADGPRPRRRVRGRGRRHGRDGRRCPRLWPAASAAGSAARFPPARRHGAAEGGVGGGAEAAAAGGVAAPRAGRAPAVGIGPRASGSAHHARPVPSLAEGARPFSGASWGRRRPPVAGASSSSRGGNSPPPWPLLVTNPPRVPSPAHPLGVVEIPLRGAHPTGGDVGRRPAPAAASARGGGENDRGRLRPPGRTEHRRRARKISDSKAPRTATRPPRAAISL